MLLAAAQPVRRFNVNSRHVSGRFATSQLFNKCVSISQIGAFSLYRIKYKPPHVSLKTFLCKLEDFLTSFGFSLSFFLMRCFVKTRRCKLSGKNKPPSFSPIFFFRTCRQKKEKEFHNLPPTRSTGVMRAALVLSNNCDVC